VFFMATTIVSPPNENGTGIGIILGLILAAVIIIGLVVFGSRYLGMQQEQQQQQPTNINVTVPIPTPSPAPSPSPSPAPTPTY
jgi:hypothetical protein